MKTKKGFLHWYYTDGLKSFLRGSWDVLRIVPHYLSFRLLLRTLFAPWHRDVSLRGWSGFNPMRSARLILGNLFSRIIGAIVRTVVLVFGGVMWVLLVLIIFILLLTYFAVPGIAFLMVVLAFAQYYILAIVFLVALLYIILWARIAYRNFFHVPYEKMDIIMLSQQKWFDRVWHRIGIDPKDVPQATLKDLESFRQFLRLHDLTLDETQEIIAWEMERQQKRELKARPFALENLRMMRPLGMYWHCGFTNTLNKFSQDLTRADHSPYSRAQYFASGEQNNVQMLELVLSRPRNNNALILGEPGVGRHMLVHQLAKNVRQGNYQGTALEHIRVLKADLAGAIAYATERGKDPALAVENYFHEAAYAGNVVLFLENFEQYMEPSRGFSYSVIMEKYAPLSTFRVIAVSTEESYHRQIEEKRALMGHFDIVHIDEPSEDIVRRILFSVFYHEDHTVFTYDALRTVVTSSERYVNTGPLPARAISLAHEVETYWEKSGSTGRITKDTVLAFVKEKTGIPVGDISPEEKEQLLSLEDHFHENIVGQNDAVNAVSEAVRRMRSGMVRPHHPAGSFLFLGPTGVGKTEMAKTLAKEYFGSAERVIRLDMSEFQGTNALDLMMGSSATGQRGRLATLVDKNPYGLLLLDEIEKANPRILDVFLQVLDEGFAHDGFGHKIHFSSMIIIATSNAGSSEIVTMLRDGVSTRELKDRIITSVTSSGTFRQEFLNRFDDVVVFEPIEGEQVKEITQKLLAKFTTRVYEEQNIGLSFTDDVADEIVARGYEKKYGARSLLRYIDESIADALAKKIIAGSVHRGDDITFSVSDIDKT